MTVPISKIILTLESQLLIGSLSPFCAVGDGKHTEDVLVQDILELKIESDLAYSLTME